MSYLEPILVHPVRRQNFGDGVAQTCNPHLIPCHMKESERFITLAPIISFPLAKIILACVFSDFPEAL